MKATNLIKVVIPATIFLFSCHSRGLAIGQARYVESTCGEGCFRLAEKESVADIYVDSQDYAGVVRAAGDLQADITRVTGLKADIKNEESGLGKNSVIIGTVGKSQIVDQLIKGGKVDVTPIAGKWESFLITVVKEPFPGVENALVIAGSDKRGTIYGIYDLSEQIGVSPWYWWADVPVEHKENLYIKAGTYIQGPPAVRYRGIFLNDEWPALGGWASENFGGFNHKFYVKVFELLLRLKANFLWPAMWSGCFGEDDPLNPKLADEYGIVMSTSHHEPMMRAWKEWGKRGHGKGTWDYSKNADIIREFWLEGIRRTRDYEKVITLAMRGDGDEPMSESENVALLEKIVADQREMIAKEINPNLSEVPQVWALYKEVQGYYERGMRVPDDVTLLWCDDNWGNIRRLPTEQERKRSGGAGVYYHFDYVGGPRSYRWINTNPIPKIWEQMNLAYHYGASRIWVVNVGDLKPMEFPIEFFLTLAWNPQRWPKEKISEYTKLWAEREFGPKHAEEIAEIVSRYAKYNGRRKPELVEPKTFSLVNYREAETVLADFKEITAKAEKIYAGLPDNAKDAFFQLVLHPTKASAVVTELYITAAKNNLYASQKRASTNDYAEKVRALFKADAELTRYYNREMAKGKWNHMMDQTHIGYTSWNEPPQNEIPKLREIEVPAGADMAVAVEGSKAAWPGASGQPVLPEFSVFTRKDRYIDVFNRGQKPFEFSAVTSAPWILLSKTQGTIDKELRIFVSIDWGKAPKGKANGSVKVSSSDGKEISVKVNSFNPTEPKRDTLEGFVEANGYVSIEAEHYTKKTDAGRVRWERIEDYGRTLSAMTVFPVTAESVQPPQNSPCLEYKIYLFNPGKIKVDVIVAPTLNFVPGRGLRFAVSFDDQPPQVLDVVPKNFNAGDGNRKWEESVKNSTYKVRSTHTLSGAGYHILKVWMVDPAVVLQKLIVDTGGLKRSYLGPPESYRGGAASSKVTPLSGVLQTTVSCGTDTDS
jgi:hypothetical protein